VKVVSRTRVVTFRLSEKEYASLKSACSLNQCSITDVARRTVLAWADSISAQPKVDQRLAEIDDRLDILCKLLSKASGK
jgi:hypothetical protein